MADLMGKLNEVKALQAEAKKETFNVLKKASIAEQAVGVSIEIIEELVKREVARNG